MEDKKQIVDAIVEKSGKSLNEVEELIKNKISELSGMVSDVGASHLVANELGVKIENERLRKSLDHIKIKEIESQKPAISFYSKILKKYDTINFGQNSDNPGSVRALLVGDETGITRISFWNDKCEVLEDVEEGDIIEVSNVYSRENKRDPTRIDVHFGQYSELVKNPEGVSVNVVDNRENIEFTHKKVEELEDNQRNVKISGVVTNVELPRFYLGCPTTYKKVIQDNGVYISPATNEPVEPMKVSIVNLTIDDGSGNLNIVGFRDRAEKLTEKDSEYLVSLISDIDEFEKFEKEMLGAKVEVGGNISLSSMTGEKQLLVNEILNITKTEKEVAKELVEEDKKEEETLKKDDKKEEGSDDDFLKDIEEIDIDDDLI